MIVTLRTIECSSAELSRKPNTPFDVLATNADVFQKFVLCVGSVTEFSSGDGIVSPTRRFGTPK